MEFTRAIFFSLPFILAGLVHVAVIRYDLLRALAGLPLDFGFTFRGRRIFGANKTFRGALTMTVTVAAWFVLMAECLGRFPLAASLAPVDFHAVNPLVFGPLLGLGCVLGELPNSFLKRQLDIAPGQPARGFLGPIFWLLDQVDSLLGVLLFASLFWKLTWMFIAYTFIITLIIHPAGALIMVLFGLKSRLG